MDEFLQQFLVESRELVDQATQDLLALEKSPTDRERFDSAFRAFHTLKGGAGIVEFAAMESMVHRAESVLVEARTHAAPLSAREIGDCLRCLDQILRWLDTIEDTGDLPKDADAAAAAVVARFARPADRRPTPDSATTVSWAAAVMQQHPDVAARAATAVRYRPDGDSFFREHDPLALIAALPGLLAVDAAPAEPWPRLADLDPFHCYLVITALVEATAAETETALGDEVQHCDVEALSKRSADLKPSARAREVLEAQAALLAAIRDQHHPGHIASAGVVAANVLRHLGRTGEADRIADLGSICAADNSPETLRAAILASLNALAGNRPAAPETAGRTDTRAQTLRVDASRIDLLVRLTGELTVAKNSIGHAVKLAEAERSSVAVTLKNGHGALDRLVGELQRAVLGMRVLPLRTAFQRFPRLIREMAAELGKPVTLVVEGEDTEADKAIVEVLVEPLLHILRNAMDHGVESAATRAAVGKAPVATMTLRAFREGEHVVVEVSDDGRGIDVARVREVARERGVLPGEALDAMSDDEVIGLIFAPGFSTATTVTDLSGRGVGMDAVRTAVRRLGGHVDVESVAGKRTTVRFTLPFSVMMTQVMTVEAGAQSFGIPLDAIVETLRVPADGIFGVGAAQALILRDRTVPLVNLAEILGGAAATPCLEETVSVVVTKVDGELGALRVDKVGERMEIMLKPLDGLLSGTPGIAGSTLLGDGTVLLVLDMGELLR